MKARVTVFPRPEILDPEGKAIGDALARLGFTEISELRAGRSFDIELQVEDASDIDAARQRLDEMCRKLLANPVVEDYRIEVPLPSTASNSSGSSGSSGSSETGA